MKALFSSATTSAKTGTHSLGRLTAALSATLFTASLLTACGSGSSGGSNGPVVSGTVSLADSLALDSDVNDTNADFSSNNDPLNPQILTSNVLTLQGFASAVPTQDQNDGSAAGQRFYASADQEDYFQVTLQAGQRILLQVADYSSRSSEGPYSGDLDLYLYDPAEPNPVESSTSTDSSESITVPYDGTFLVNVYAFEGVSKYILTLSSAEGSTEQCSVSSSASASFIPGEAIVRWKDTSAGISGLSSGLKSVASASRDISLGDMRVTSQASAGKHAVKARITDTKASPSALAISHPGWAKAKDTINTIKRLNARDDVEYAEPNYVRKALQTPNDPFYDLQFHYEDISLPSAWDITTGSSDVIVAVIDSGVLLAHPDLDDHLTPGYDFISDPDFSNDGDGIDSNPDDPGDCSPTPCDSTWHGTHVSGTVAAETDNDEGVAGVSWQSRVMPLRVLGLESSGSNYDVLQAMLFAAGLDNDSGTFPAETADIINLSLGGAGNSRAEQDVIDDVRAAGVIIVAAAGNESSNCPSYPAAYDGVISVSATAPDDSLAYYSNFGESIDVAAPGGDLSYTVRGGVSGGIASTYVDDSSGDREPAYAQLEGTSMATPHVAGVIALMKAVYPDMTPAEFDSMLASGSITDDLGSEGRDDSFGYGLINALKAVQVAQDVAAGGDIPQAASVEGLISDPVSLNIGSANNGQLELTYRGDNQPASIEFSFSATWLTVDDEQANDFGLGDYQLNVDRTDLEDGIYSTVVTFTANTGDEVSVTVTMQVGSATAPSDLPPVYVLLINNDTGDVIAEAQANPNSGVFAIGNVPLGTYRVQAGSDIDVDLYICQSAEVCGEYTDLIEVTEEGVSDLFIPMELVPTTGTSPLSVKAVKK